LSVVFLGRTLLKLFPTPLAMLGTSVFLTNYWALKYSQQVKQYSTDLLVSSLFLYLLVTYLLNDRKRGAFWALLLVGGSSVFLSYTAVFWFPVSVLSAAFSASVRSGREHSGSDADSVQRRLVDFLTISFVYIASFGVAYRWFIWPNKSPSLTQFWINEFIGSGGLVRSLVRLFQNTCDLMLPQTFGSSRCVSYLCGLAVLWGLIKALMSQYDDGHRARIIFLTTSLPVGTGVLASMFHDYPLLGKPRMVIWMLPVCTVLLLYAVEPLWSWLSEKAGARTSSVFIAISASAICVAAIWLSSVVVVEGRSNPLDDFRSGVQYLEIHFRPHDHVFVYALGAEELEYYSRRFDWHPQSVFVGDTNLSCCIPSAPLVAGDDLRAQGLAEDVHSFMQGVGRDRAWFLLQSGIHQKFILEQASSESGSAKCQESTASTFESTVVLAFDCSSHGARPGLK
jgi:hypothetical protein